MATLTLNPYKVKFVFLKPLFSPNIQLEHAMQWITLHWVALMTELVTGGPDNTLLPSVGTVCPCVSRLQVWAGQVYSVQVYSVQAWLSDPPPVTGASLGRLELTVRHELRIWKNEKLKFLIRNKNDLPASTSFSLRKHTHSPLTLTIFDLKGKILRNENEICVARGKRFQKICKKYSILKRPVYGTTIYRSAAVNFW